MNLDGANENKGEKLEDINNNPNIPITTDIRHRGSWKVGPVKVSTYNSFRG